MRDEIKIINDLLREQLRSPLGRYKVVETGDGKLKLELIKPPDQSLRARNVAQELAQEWK